MCVFAFITALTQQKFRGFGLITSFRLVTSDIGKNSTINLIINHLLSVNNYLIKL
ncbi:hypothetical protein BH10PSE19_BH10PSE19_22820 [soil metagenome]